MSSLSTISRPLVLYWRRQTNHSGEIEHSILKCPATEFFKDKENNKLALKSQLKTNQWYVIILLCVQKQANPPI